MDDINPTIVDNEGNTILMITCNTGFSKIALTLIDRFEDKCLPNQINSLGETAISIAKKNNMVEVVSKLEELKN